MLTSDHYRTASLSLPECLDILRDAATHDHGIRDFLLRSGITGYIGSSTDCPVARWILQETGAEGVRVDSWSVEVMYPGRRIASEYTPVTLAEHLDDFDGGKYPELEAS